MTEQHSRPLIITRVRQQGPDIRSFDLMPADASGAHGVAFIPGQVAMLRVGEEEPTYFAFASGPRRSSSLVALARTLNWSLFRSFTSCARILGSMAFTG